MAQLNITLNQEEILQLLSADRDEAFRTMLQNSLNSILKVESQDQLQATPYERSEKRTDSRNGSRERDLNTRIGRITLTVPRHRNQPFDQEHQNQEKDGEMDRQSGRIAGFQPHRNHHAKPCEHNGYLSKHQRLLHPGIAIQHTVPVNHPIQLGRQMKSQLDRSRKLTIFLSNPHSKQ